MDMIEEGGDTKLNFTLEKLVQRLVNDGILKGTGFRISTPTNVDRIKRLFGHALSDGQLQKLSGHDGIVCLFSMETVQKDREQKMLPDRAIERRTKRRYAGAVPMLVEKYFGKPVLELNEATDMSKGFFGDVSYMVHCFFALDESSSANFVM